MRFSVFLSLGVFACTNAGPTRRPTRRPTSAPTKVPTRAPTRAPTRRPTTAPTRAPTRAPTGRPTTASRIPTKAPTPVPSSPPTLDPTKSPTKAPTLIPTSAPTKLPTRAPTRFPTLAPAPPVPVPTSPPLQSSLLQNWNFESASIDPWQSTGGAAVVQRIYDSGRLSHVATISGRSSGSWQGIGQVVTSVLQPGEDYIVRISAKLHGSYSGIRDRFMVTLAIQDDSDDIRYEGMIYSENGLTDQWKTFEGHFGPLNIVGTAKWLRVYAEGPAMNRNFAIDDFVILPDLSTPSPTAAPTVPPTTPDYIVGSTLNTARVTLRHPPQADFSPNNARSNCPHLGGTYVNWHSLYGGLLAGQNVTLPLNTAVLVTQSISSRLGFVTIPRTSSLIFGENSTEINMNVQGIKVEGSLIAGSATCRLQTKLTITLHGSRPTVIKDPVYKGIDVTGVLSLHGKRFFRTWTRLAKRAHSGDTFLYLQDLVNWEPGQEIVLVTTAMRDSRDWHENEVFVIDRVVTSPTPHPDVKAVVYLTSPIEHAHIARQEYQAEVGLLTRNIKIQGAESDSKPTDTEPTSCQLYDDYGGERSSFGYDEVTCPDTYLTGYGGHIFHHSGGRGYVEGVELYRMGQTNVLGKYPIHYHVLANGCSDCYFRDSSVHESYYRCISIHGTHNLTVSENVAYDVTGFCYYLEDGVEEDNTLSYNLAAHIHFIGDPAIGGPQKIRVVEESPTLLLPADVAASGFYITNMHNIIIGNVASGGWAGFAFPNLAKPVGFHRTMNYVPKEKVSLEIDGNTAHSTAHFWSSAAAFYFGGALYYNGNNKLEYNAGRDNNGSEQRSPCNVDPVTNECVDTQNLITNSKVFMVANVGIGSWSGMMDVVRYEAHDVGLALEALASGFWIDQMTVVCRTTEKLKLPIQRARYIRGNGFVWYDTGQDHIISDSTFEACGTRADEYNQYDSSPTRGCGSSDEYGCTESSSVFSFLTHSDQFNPEIMQATKNIQMTNVGRRFRFTRTDIETVSGRTQNWLDSDGTVSGWNEPTLIGSGLQTAGLWWRVDDDVFNDPQGPLVFVKKNQGPARGLAHVRLEWDEKLHDTVGSTDCVNGRDFGALPLCAAKGYIRHLGGRFSSDNGLPVTAQPEIVGLAGGFGWLLKLNDGAPKELKISEVEVLPETPLLFSVQYPLGTSVSVKAKAAWWCTESCSTSCEETFKEVASVTDVRKSDGNVFHHDRSTGLVTIRIIMFPLHYTGLPDWKLYNFNDIGNDGGYALDRFEREGVLLPKGAYNEAHISILANCTRGGGNNAFCANSRSNANFDSSICSPGYVQVSYDRCCQSATSSTCEYPYSVSPPPAPGPTMAPTYNPQILDNGGFEDGLCPWYFWRAGVLSSNSTVKKTGNFAALVSNRQEYWEGPRQDILGKLKLDRQYQFQGFVYIEAGGSTNTIEVKIESKYEGCSNNRYHTVYSGQNLPGRTWHKMESTYNLKSSDLAQSCTLTGLTLYVESWGGKYNFLLDDLSMIDVSGIVL